MPHIEFPEHLPGILGPLMFRPESAGPLNELAEVLLRDENSLSRGERELIAAYVSSLNNCTFCGTSHSVFAARQLDGGPDLVAAVNVDPETAEVSAKMKALLAVAGKVQQSGLAVTEDDIERARSEGATDVEIHDTVLIAAAFCMFNRYVDGLATVAPTDPAEYQVMGERTVEEGYRPLPPRGVAGLDGPDAATE